MLAKITAIVPSRNLLTPLKNTIDFLLKDDRIEIVLYDQNSTYIPLLEYYNNLPDRVIVIYTKTNEGPHSVWFDELIPYRKNYFIVTDPDCSYEGIPEDWLDVMLDILETTNIPKVGFSIRLDDLPENNYTNKVKEWESKFWEHKSKYGWSADIDTTFALYRPNSGFVYEAIRLDEPYCMKHLPWYLTKQTLTSEWEYYIQQTNYTSYWGNKLKHLLWD